MEPLQRSRTKAMRCSSSFPDLTWTKKKSPKPLQARLRGHSDTVAIISISASTQLVIDVAEDGLHCTTASPKEGKPNDFNSPAEGRQQPETSAINTGLATHPHHTTPGSIPS